MTNKRPIFQVEEKLNELNKIEMRDIAFKLCRDMTNEIFEAMWQEFVRRKMAKRLH